MKLIENRKDEIVEIVSENPECEEVYDSDQDISFLLLILFKWPAI